MSSTSIIKETLKQFSKIVFNKGISKNKSPKKNQNNKKSPPRIIPDKLCSKKKN
jgi:hypothetical protein